MGSIQPKIRLSSSSMPEWLKHSKHQEKTATKLIPEGNCPSTSQDSGFTYMNEDFKLPQGPVSKSLFKLMKHSIVYEPTGLKQGQCETVMESWESLTTVNPRAFGMRFFVKFFQEFPDYRNFFPTLRGEGDSMDLQKNKEELEMLKHSTQLEEVSDMFMESMTSVINALDKQQEVTQILYLLADRHVPRGILSLHFQDMLSFLMTYLEEKTGRGKMPTNTRDAWTVALQTIVTIIDERYLAISHKKPLQNKR